MMRRLLVAAIAALALAVACATGELRSNVGDDSGDDAVSTSMPDSLDALPAASAAVSIAPPLSSGRVVLDLQFPPSRATTADVFRPPQA
jgi:hypothetical protein